MGTVLDSTGIVISITAYKQGYPSIAWDGTNYLVVWHDSRGESYDIYGTRVSPDGIVLDSNGIAISTASDRQEYPSVAWNGTNYLVVWQDERSGGRYDIYGARVTSDGMVLDSTGIAIHIGASYPYNKCYPTVVWNGTNYLVVWGNYYNMAFDLYGAEVNVEGIVIDSFTVSINPGNQQLPAIATGAGKQSLIVYSGWAPTINDHPAEAMRICGKFFPFIGEEEKETRSKRPEARLFQNQLNPFVKSIIIKYQLPVKSNVSLKIYDVTGRIVKTLVNTEKEPGYYNASLDAKDLASGIYFAKFVAGDYKETRN